MYKAESVELSAVRTEVLEYLTQDQPKTPHHYDRNARMCNAIRQVMSAAGISLVQKNFPDSGTGTKA